MGFMLFVTCVSVLFQLSFPASVLYKVPESNGRASMAWVKFVRKADIS